MKQAARGVRHEGCEIGELLQLLGRPYVLEILHLFVKGSQGPLRFVDIQKNLRLSPNTLSERLRSLVDAGLLTRTPYNEIPPRVDYETTPKATALCPVFDALDLWSERNNLRPGATGTVTAAQTPAATGRRAR